MSSLDQKRKKNEAIFSEEQRAFCESWQKHQGIVCRYYF